jgi:hypothetical protein
VGAVLAAIVGAVVLVGLSVVVEIVRRRRQSRVRGLAELRPVLVSLRELLGTVVAHGGRDVSAFLSEQPLSDVIGRLGDDELRVACARVLDEYRMAWASAPPARYLVNLDAPPDSDRQKQYDRQVEHARAGLVAIDDAIKRADDLERRFG